MTNKELLQLFEKPEDEKAYLEFMFGDGKKHIMEKIIATDQFREFFPEMIKHSDEYWDCFGKNDVEKILGNHMSWLGYLSDNKDPLPCKNINGENSFDMFTQLFTFNGERYWVVSIYGQGSTTWICNDKEFFENYIVEFPDTGMKMGKLIVEPENVIGTLSSKHHADTFVLNWGDSSCVLIMDNFNILDLRKIPFDKLTCVELNGVKFVRKEINDV